MPLGSVMFSLTRMTGTDEQWFATMFAKRAAHHVHAASPGWVTLASHHRTPSRGLSMDATGSFFNDRSDRSVMPCEALVFLRP